MNNQKENNIKCDFCDAGAIVNFQKVWIKFLIDKSGRYKKDKNFCSEDFEQPMNKNNRHLCEKHLESFLKGEI